MIDVKIKKITFMTSNYIYRYRDSLNIDISTYKKIHFRYYNRQMCFKKQRATEQSIEKIYNLFIKMPFR